MKGTFLGVPSNKGHRILRYIGVSLFFGKLPYNLGGLNTLGVGST